MKWLKNLLTKDDDETFDEIKVGAFVVLVSASAALWNASVLCIWLVVFQGEKAFDANAFLTGIGSFLLGAAAVITATGGGMGLRDKLTPRGPT